MNFNEYISLIRTFYNGNNDIVKLIYGNFGTNKTNTLKYIINDLKSLRIKDDHIIFIDFEALEYGFIRDNYIFKKYIDSLIIDNKMYYIILNEVQNIKDINKTISELNEYSNTNIFITLSIRDINKLNVNYDYVLLDNKTIEWNQKILYNNYIYDMRGYLWK